LSSIDSFGYLLEHLDSLGTLILCRFKRLAPKKISLQVSQPCVMAQAHGKALESSEPNDQERLEFFSLPLEIRIQVTEYVLVPGEIHLRPAPLNRPEPRSNAIQKGVNHFINWRRRLGYACKHDWGENEDPHHILGVQFLATCKQAYEEGQEM